jgi:hypothetical protein
MYIIWSPTCHHEKDWDMASQAYHLFPSGFYL